LLELFLTGDQIATYTSVSSSGNSNGVKVRLQGVETLGGPEDVFRIVVRQVSEGQDAFQNGQFVDIYTWPDDEPVVSNLNPQHDQFQGRASSDSHQIFTSHDIVIDLDGFDGSTVQYGPGLRPLRSEQLRFDEMLQSPPAVPCYVAGTRIAVPGGWRDVAELRPGDLVETRDNGAQPVLWAGSRRVVGRGVFAPVAFAPGALGNTRPLLVSPQHRVLLADWRTSLWFGAEEVLVAAQHLVGCAGVRRVERAGLHYVHLLLERHEVLNAEGAPAESLHLGPYAVGCLLGPSRREIETLFPDLAGQVPHGLPTARRCLRGWEARMIVAEPLAA